MFENNIVKGGNFIFFIEFLDNKKIVNCFIVVEIVIFFGNMYNLKGFIYFWFKNGD